MKLLAKLALVLTVLTAFCTQLKAQIDTTWTYFHYQTDGTRVAGPGPGIPVDIRLTNYEFGAGTPNRFYLTENKTFSFRRNNNGDLTDSYHPMAGFTSTIYTQGQLRSEAGVNNDRFRMNYRLLFPRNYTDNPNVEGGYPMIVMTHGFGERANCWGTNCYWADKVWNTLNTLETLQISSVVGSSGTTGYAIFTLASGNLDNFSTNTTSPQNPGHNVIIRTNVSGYNGLRRLIKIGGTGLQQAGATQFRLSTNLTSTSPTTSPVNFSTGITSGTIEYPQANTHRISAAASDGGGTVFTTDTPHQFVIGQDVVIRNSNITSYNGTRQVTAVTANTFTLNVATSGTFTGANVARTGVFELLNNDHSMTHGGNVHRIAVMETTPAGMIPSDPNMPIRAFPGFVLYPQNLNGWEQGGAENAVRIIRLLMKKYNINPNKVYVHGLSDGGSAVYRLVRTAPWMFAAALPMSAVNNPENLYPIYQYINSIPLWIFQGGVDGNPTKATTEQLIKNFRNAGMDVRYTLYPTLGHGVWNNAYAEQDFFRWMMLRDKANIQVKFNDRTICGTSGASKELILAQGFLAYEWEKDGVTIPGASAYSYAANFPGTYRARFSRKLNPGPTDWNRWSDPIVITEVSPPKPVLQALNSSVFPTVNPWPDVTVIIKPSEKSEKYNWYINGSVATNLWKPGTPPIYVGTSDTTYRILAAYDRLGAYTLKTTNISGCESPSSDPVHVINPGSATLTAPGSFVGTAQNGSTIFLSWTDNSVVENGYEIWRKKASETLFTFVARTQEDVVSFLDTNLTPVTTYHYKIRAVSNSARSTAVPSDDLNTNLVVATLGDNILPTPPQNLQVTLNTIKSISLAWEPGTDNNGVNRYKVNYVGTPSGSIFTTGPTTSLTINGLNTNNAYQITVQTEDLAGNLSPPSNQITGLTYVDGLYYEHSTGAWSSLTPSISAQSDTPAIDWVSAEFTGKISNFNINPNITFYGEPPGIATQQDFYKIKFSGYFAKPPGAFNDIFQFQMLSNDGSMLHLKGFNPSDVSQHRIINNDGVYAWSPSGDVTLDSAYHRITVLFREFIDGQELTIQYRRKTGSNSYDPTWTTIPDALLRTGNYTPPTQPNIPTSLTAIATGMTSVSLSWLYSGPAAEFEVYRSTAINGTYEIIAHATGSPFVDNTALPGTTYYYKLKAVNANGASDFSNTDDATTTSDLLPPTTPTNLTLISKTFSNVAFSWTASSDNVGVAGYLILVNGIVMDTATVTSHMVTGLEPGTLYNFSVKAFDATGLESPASTVLAETTIGSVIYYSKATGALGNANTWGLNTDGSGTIPNLTFNGQFYRVANRATTGLDGSPLTIGGSISKIIVPTGTTFTVDNTISAKLEVQGNAIVNLNNTNTAPEFLTVSPTSTINFINYTSVPANTYGHINLSGTGNKNFAEGETVIMGNLTATTDIALKGVASNTSHVTVHGDITLAGTPGVVATDNALDLTLAKGSAQTLTLSGPLDLYKLSTITGTNVNVVNGGSAITLNVGSPNGGGLVLANGTTLNLGNNHLVLKNAANINAGGETGMLAINGSNLTLNSSSTQNSNMYFDTTLKTAGMVTSTFSSTGKLMIQSPLTVTGGLKIKAGEVRSSDPLQPTLPGNITLFSDQNTTAYLQEMEGNGSVTGKVNVQRWVSVARKYRYMSSVVENMTVALWQQGGMNITGPFTGTSGSQTPSMFYFHEPDINPNSIPPHNGYNRFPVSSNSEMLQRGRGYSIFNYSNAALTLTMTGRPYQGSVPFTLTPGSAGNTGWNLVGNPYASAIQWNNLTTDWTRSGMNSVVYVPDNTTGTLRYYTYDAETGLGLGGSFQTLTGGIIAPGQAFWVKATTTNPSLTIHEKAKRTNTSTFYREEGSPVNHFVIRLSNGTSEDNAIVVLGDQYEDTFEPELDGMKYKNQVLNLSTRSADNINLVFNKLSDSFCEKIIPLTLEEVTVGNYSLAFDNLENLVGVGEIELIDHFTNTTLPLTTNTPYNFEVTTDEASKGMGRFSLTVHRPALQKNAVATAESVCGGTSATIQLTNTQPGVFYYATRLNEGTQISEVLANEAGNMVLSVPTSALQAGSNSLVIHTGFKGCSDELLSTTPLVFNYTPSPVVAIDKPFLSLCADSQITLQAETNSANSLRWYKDGTLLSNQTSSSWLSDPLKKTTLFEVAAVNNGCEGKKESVYVEINRVTVPLVEFDGDALEIVNEIPADNFVQWYLNGSPLDAYDKGIVPEAEGIYSVLVAKGGCSQVSEPFEFLVTGVENPAGEAFQAYVYPNPATFDELYVKLETSSKQNATVTLVDLTGRTAFTQSINGNAGNGVHKLNVEQDTTPGLYIMQIQQGDAVVQRKVIIQFK
jgi:fibronectin type 3 domain-containing protein